MGKNFSFWRPSGGVLRGRFPGGARRTPLALLLSAALMFIAIACTGTPGTAGPQGDTGPQGPAGERGATGASGESGAVGPAGPAGAAGAEGSAGTTGGSGQAIAAVLWIGDPGLRDGSRNKRFLPNSLEVSSGETIRVLAAGSHQAAVYKVEAGTTREDVTANPNAFVDTTIDDAGGDR